MGHKSKWFKNICKLKPNQDCYNCKNKIKIEETKKDITVYCLYGNRKLIFKRYSRAACGAWEMTPKQ